MLLRHAILKAEMESAMAILAKKQKELVEKETLLAELQEQCEISMAEKQRLDMLTQQLQSRLRRSTKLVTALTEEHIRWEENILVSFCFNCMQFCKILLFLYL